MERVAIEDVEHSPHPRGVTDGRRLLAEAFGMEDVDVTYYEVSPGDRFAGAYHRHLEREELFLVVEGTAVFRTEFGSVEVNEGEAIYFAPGDWQLGRNDRPATVEALMIGHPKPLAPVEAYLDCPNCEDERIFVVEPGSQEPGEAVPEERRCTDCGESFEL